MAESISPVAWVGVADSHAGPYSFHGIEYLPAGQHELYTAAQLEQARREEAAKHVSEIGRLRDLAATAEKWRGIACAKFGDGRTVAEIQDEARAEERKMVAYWYEFSGYLMDESDIPNAIRDLNEQGGS